MGPAAPNFALKPSAMAAPPWLQVCAKLKSIMQVAGQSGACMQGALHAG